MSLPAPAGLGQAGVVAALLTSLCFAVPFSVVWLLKGEASALVLELPSQTQALRGTSARSPVLTITCSSHGGLVFKCLNFLVHFLLLSD